MKISVIIPFYNLERYVNECLDSVAAAAEKLNGKLEERGSACAKATADRGGGQRANPLFVEVICVDDGSMDGTGALLDGFATNASTGDGRSAVTFSPSLSTSTSPSNIKFKVIHQPNGGEGAARNAGMAAATGDWITFLDGDDVWLENHLAVAVPALMRHPDADLVSFRFAPFEDGAHFPQTTEYSVLPDVAGAPRPHGDGCLPCGCDAPAASLSVFDLRQTVPDAAILDIGVYPTFYRRTFLEGASFSRLPLGADRLFVAQCLARANRAAMGATVIHGYRLRANSMAHCAWSARKVMSQCDYALDSLKVLSASGKALGRKGMSYLASLWLSDVPNRVLRLRGTDRREAWTHWAETLNGGEKLVMPFRFDVARRILSSCRCLVLSLLLARFMRKVGIV